MPLRPFVRISAASGAIILALVLAMPAAAMPAPPGAPPPLGAPDMRPEWRGLESLAVQLDPRSRDVWLGECRRRTAYYYGGFRRHRHWGRHDEFAPRYDYCEAYLDDYYRYYSQAGYGYAVQSYGPAQPICEEVVTERDVPYATRLIPPRHMWRRPPPDKRIRIVPGKRVRVD